MADAPAPRRHAGIELGRAVAMLAVVLIHVPPVASLNAWLRPLAELGVPYFFVVSGFLWARGQQGRELAAPAPGPSWRAALAPLRRPLALYAWGVVVYALLPLDWPAPLRQGRLGAAIASTAHGSLDALLRAPLATLFDGPPGGFHLWFLPALALGLGAVIAGVRLHQERLLAGSALALFAFGLLAGRYAETRVGIPLGWSVRNGPFQAVALVGAGAFLAGRSWDSPTSTRGLGPLGRPGWRGVCLLALGGFTLAAESRWLGPVHSPGPDVYSLAVLPLGVGAFLAAYDLHIASTRAQRVAVWLGGTTLGVYLWHVLLRMPLASLLAALGLYPERGGNPAWGFVELFALSVLAVVAWRLWLRVWARVRFTSGGDGGRKGQRPSVELEAL